MSHKNHNVLGRYCWDCKTKTDTGIPYWPIAHQGEYTHYSPWAKSDITGQGYTESIIWANGDSDRRQNQNEPCAMCNKHCGHPVSKDVTDRGDNYREIGQVREF
jgi:hypothetical protein